MSRRHATFSAEGIARIVGLTATDVITNGEFRSFRAGSDQDQFRHFLFAYQQHACGSGAQQLDVMGLCSPNGTVAELRVMPFFVDEQGALLDVDEASPQSGCRTNIELVRQLQKAGWRLSEHEGSPLSYHNPHERLRSKLHRTGIMILVSPAIYVDSCIEEAFLYQNLDLARE